MLQLQYLLPTSSSTIVHRLFNTVLYRYYYYSILFETVIKRLLLQSSLVYEYSPPPQYNIVLLILIMFTVSIGYSGEMVCATLYNVRSVLVLYFSLSRSLDHH
uniref:Uncharacterized protein n=1 Tax=Cacopsylla melanoneura TaxID=428564 RepID=A0A8D8QVJ5_9HEMI